MWSFDDIKYEAVKHFWNIYTEYIPPNNNLYLAFLTQLPIIVTMEGNQTLCKDIT